jgi:hypothetical protein
MLESVRQNNMGVGTATAEIVSVGCLICVARGARARAVANMEERQLD